MMKKKRYIVKRTGKDVTLLVERDNLSFSIKFGDKTITGRAIRFKNGVIAVLKPEAIIVDTDDVLIFDIDDNFVFNPAWDKDKKEEQLL